MSFEEPKEPGSIDPKRSFEPPMQPQEPLRTDVARVPLRLPSTKPTVTYTILGLTILVFIAQQVSTSLLGGDLPAALGMKINSRIIAGEYWRLFTPMLLHGSIGHILFNMYALFALGRSLEKMYGHTRFILLYFIGSLAGNTASFIFSPNNSLGASTAIFGLVAAQGVTIYLNRKIFGSQARNMISNVVFVIVVNLGFGLASSGIDSWGHIGGLIGGGVYAMLAGPLFIIEGIYPDLRLTDQHSGNLPYLVAGVEAAAILLLATFGA